MDVEPAIADLIGDVAFDPDALREKYREERDKRLRPDANEQYVEVKAEFSHYVDDPVRRARLHPRARCSTRSRSPSSAAASAAC